MPAGPSPRKGWIHFRKLGLKVAALADWLQYFEGKTMPAPTMAELFKKFLRLSFIGAPDCCSVIVAIVPARVCVGLLRSAPFNGKLLE
jgi:hypothetical protein